MTTPVFLVKTKTIWSNGVGLEVKFTIFSGAISKDGALEKEARERLVTLIEKAWAGVVASQDER